MDDTSQVQGPPAPGEEPTHADFKPVTLAPSPPPSESVEQSQSTQMKVPDFVRDLPIEHQAVQQQSGQQPVAVVTTWREQLPTASLAIVLGTALVAWSIWQRRKIAKKSAARLAAPVKSAASTEEQQLHRDMTELTERLVHQLDVRTARMEKMLEQADERIATLEKLLVAKPQPTVEVKPRHSAPMASLDTSAGNSHRDVYALADEGLTPVQIAQRLSKPTGQVELILNLRRVSLV